MPIQTSIHQSSDLSRHYRAILNEARDGCARLRDTDGTSLVMLTEARVEALETITSTAANFITVECAFAPARGRRPAITEMGEWTWLRVFDADDIEEFLNELRGALIAASRERNPQPIHETLAAWRTTADSLIDPTRRRILLEPVKEGDLVEVPRPADAERLPAVPAG